MVAAPSADLSMLDQILSRAKPQTSPKIAAAFALSLAIGIIGPVAVYAVTRDPPMTASELVILHALIDYAADKTGQDEDAVWRELHLHGALDRASQGASRAQWADAVKYLTNRVGIE